MPLSSAPRHRGPLGPHLPRQCRRAPSPRCALRGLGRAAGFCRSRAERAASPRRRLRRLARIGGCTRARQPARRGGTGNPAGAHRARAVHARRRGGRPDRDSRSGRSNSTRGHRSAPRSGCRRAAARDSGQGPPAGGASGRRTAQRDRARRRLPRDGDSRSWPLGPCSARGCFGKGRPKRLLSRDRHAQSPRLQSANGRRHNRRSRLTGRRAYSESRPQGVECHQ